MPSNINISDDSGKAYTNLGCLNRFYSIFNKSDENSKLSKEKNLISNCNTSTTITPKTIKISNGTQEINNKFVLNKDNKILPSSPTTSSSSSSSSSLSSELNNKFIDKYNLSKINLKRLTNETDEEYEMRKKEEKLLTNDSGYDGGGDDDNSNHSDDKTIIINNNNNEIILSVEDYINVGNNKITNNDKDNKKTIIIIDEKPNDCKIKINNSKMIEAKNLNNHNFQRFQKSEIKMRERITSKTSSNFTSDDDEDEDEDELLDIVHPLPRRRSALRPDLTKLIRQLDDDALKLNGLIIENGTNGEPSIFAKSKSTDHQLGFRPRLYERKRSRNPSFGSLRNITEEEDENLPSEQKQLTDLKFPNLLPPNPCLRVLLAFPKNDNVFDAILNACQRLNFEVKECKTTAAASELFQNSTNGGQHIIVVDGRHPKNFDPEIIGRAIRNSKGSQHTIMVAVLKKSTFEKDDTAILSLLDAGFNRCFVESPHISICSSELRQIQHSLVRPQNVISTQQALYTALHRSREPMIITDDLLRTQYANKATERLLNMRLDEIVGRPLAELLNTDVTPITMQTNRHREYDGVLPIKRKTQEIVGMHLRATPVVCIGRNPTHLVITIDLPGSGEPLPIIPQNKEAPRGSLHSIRRGSVDVRSIASDGLRRTSLAKLSSLPLEAPITKVVTLLSQVQENCSPDEARLLDKVMEFLKREGLYSPQMKEIRTDDPVATDLIGALLLQGPSSILSSRRSSNDSIIRASRTSTSITPVKMKGSSQLTDLLNKSLDWDFDIFRLEEMTEKRPLLYLGMELFRRFDFFNSFNIDETTVKSWLVVIEAHYHTANTYHNSTHAADVMQATAAFLQQLSVKELNILDRMEEASSLIAAATHDIDHPGRSSAFLCNSDNPLAILYNDTSVLESHHTATTFRLTLADDKINIFKNLDKESYKLARMVIIDMILATEMTKHFEHLAKFVSVFGTDVEGKEIIHSECDDNEILIRRMLIKCADVSNPTRPLSYCVEWARRIAEEYFTQTDEEKKRNLPIVMPMFDRATCSISKSQIGFIEYIIQDMMQAWDGFIDMPELIQYMQYNYTQWKLFEQQGIHTLTDIEIKQSTLTDIPLSELL